MLSFKTRACAAQVFEELEKMLGSPRLAQNPNSNFREIHFHEWKVFPAVPSEDIIWQNIDRLMQKSSWTKFLCFLQPIFISSVAIFSILFLEVLSLHYIPKASAVCLYFTTTMFVVFCFYATPYLVYKSVEQEKYALKSLREKAFMRRLVIIEILNVLIIPVCFNVLLVFFGPKGYRGKPDVPEDYSDDHTIRVDIDIIAYIEEFLLRFIAQSIVAVIFFQWRSDPRVILKTFLSGFMTVGRNKFKHYLYDLGLRNVMAVTMFTIGLTCSVLVPLALPLCSLLFFLSYAIDKYNLFFVYPIDFESQLINRKSLIQSTFVAILLFQVVTITAIAGIIDHTSAVYLYTFLVIQILICLIIFEFVRSPWKGARLTIEEAEEELENRLFEDDDISKYDFGGEHSVAMPGETTLIGLKKQEVITAEDKVTALKTNYEDPFIGYIKTMRNQVSDEALSIIPAAYTAPTLSQPSPQAQPETKSW